MLPIWAFVGAIWYLLIKSAYKFSAFMFSFLFIIIDFPSSDIAPPPFAFKKYSQYKDISEFAPIIFTISTMIFTYNIGSGIIAGFIIYPIMKLLCGQKNKTNIITWILFVLSIIFFIIYPY